MAQQSFKLVTAFVFGLIISLVGLGYPAYSASLQMDFEPAVVVPGQVTSPQALQATSIITHIISDGSVKYSETAHPDWNTPTFDDSDWPTVAAPSGGLCDPGENPTFENSNALSVWGQNPYAYQQVYLRKTFTISQPLSSAQLQLLVDDDSKLYINGILLAEEHNGQATHSEFEIAHLLQTGQNIIAIHAFDNGNCQWVAFDLALSQVVASTPVPPDTVRVLDEFGRPVVGAQVYRNSGTLHLTDAEGQVTLNNLSPGETLLAMQPVYTQPTHRSAHNATGSENFVFQVYRTSAPLSLSGSDGTVTPYIVAQANQGHTLTVRPDQTLVLFNLLVSVEWDASEDYLAELKAGLRQMSHGLYNATDGQMALGWVSIYDNRRQWDNADIQIRAHNHTWPHAYIGGLNTTGAARLSYKGIDPAPGRIVLGRYWDGKGSDIGPWNHEYGYNTILHEFGHYALFLFDEYFYYPQEGNFNLRQPSHCSINPTDPASLMFYQYDKPEFCNRPNQYPEYHGGPPTRQTQIYGPAETSWVTLQGVYSDTLQQRSPGSPAWSLLSPPQRGVDFVVGPSQPPLALPALSIVDASRGGFEKQLTVEYNGTPQWGALVSLRQHSGGVIDQGLTDREGRITILGAAPGDVIQIRTSDNSLAAAVTVQTAVPQVIELSSPTGSSLNSQTITATTPLITIIPGATGETMSYFMQRTGQLSNPVLAHLSGADAPPLAEQTMGYNSSKKRYEVTFTDFVTGPLNDLTLNISTTVTGGFVEIGIGHKRGNTDGSGQDLELTSHDGNLMLNVPAAAFADPTYIVVNPTNTQPGPLPAGKVAIGQPYSIEASGSGAGASQPMAVTLAYQTVSLGDVAEESIKPYYWAASPDGDGQWTPVLSYTQNITTRQVSASASLFGIYMLLGDLPPLPVNSISPNSGDNGQPTAVYISGEAFAAGAIVKLNNTVTLTPSLLNQNTLLVEIPAGLPAGSYTMTVINPDGRQGSLPDAFTVTAFAKQQTFLPVIIK